ncbi:MAG TPA: PIN domain-containing protein [Edaphobacter sp.]|nr:PIN domain-containing protein [Edaphobacter sp.]
MSASKPEYLLDANVFYALTARDHVYHQLVKAWFYASPALRWAICSFTEAGYLRNATAPRPGQVTMSEASEVLKRLAQHPGYCYLPITVDWHTLCAPFFKRLFGHKQVTYAYLLGLAVREGLVLVTLDKAMLHLAGEHQNHVLLLK